MIEESKFLNNKPNFHDVALAFLHMGMVLADYDASPSLPLNIAEAHSRILEIFGVDCTKETNVLELRNKLIAIIESKQREVIKQ